MANLFIQTDILKELYDMDVKIEEIRGQRICIYYDEVTEVPELSFAQSM